MKNITIICDRCAKVIEGVIDDTNNGKITGGFYDVSEGIWKQYGLWEEENVCDKCMHSDPKYVKHYGKMSEK